MEKEIKKLQTRLYALLYTGFLLLIVITPVSAMGNFGSIWGVLIPAFAAILFIASIPVALRLDKLKKAQKESESKG